MINYEEPNYRANHKFCHFPIILSCIFATVCKLTPEGYFNQIQSLDIMKEMFFFTLLYIHLQIHKKEHFVTQTAHFSSA